MPRLLPPLCLLSAALLVALTGCSNSETSRSADGPTDASPTAAVSSAPKPSASPSAGPVKRTATQLQNALLARKDLPAGFEVDKSGGKDDTTMSSSKKSCAPLVRLMNSATLTGTRARADVSFSAWQEGPYIVESLDAMGTGRFARAFVESYRAAVKPCRSLRMSIAGVGSSKVAVREVSVGKLGDQAFAARFRAEGGPLDGLEILRAGVQSKDVVVGVSAVGLRRSDAVAATEEGVKKVAKKLGTPGSD